MIKRSAEIVAYEEAPSLPTTRSFSPIKVLRAMSERRKVEQEARLSELTGHVASKLLTGIEQHGMVSLFHDRETSQLTGSLYTGFFNSVTIPELYVQVFTHNIRPSDEDIQKHKQNRTNGLGPERLELGVYEHGERYGYKNASERAIDILNCWGESEDQFRLFYRRSTDKEGKLARDQWPIPEKIKFLEQILETEFDDEAMAKKWGRPYYPGDTWSSTARLPKDTDAHTAHWVRDIAHELPALIAVVPELESTNPIPIEG